MPKHTIYVYGTLRAGGSSETLSGFKMFDLGWYPGVVLTDTDDEITVERIEVDDDKLARLDRYEGYNPHRPENSLYVRHPVKDGWIYVYNQELGDARPITEGDWLVHRGEERGSYAHRFE